MKLLSKLKDQKEATKWYKINKSALNRLAQHEDFETIINYWKLEHERIDGSIDNLKGRELEDAVLERRLINKHLNWIESLTK